MFVPFADHWPTLRPVASYSSSVPVIVNAEGFVKTRSDVTPAPLANCANIAVFCDAGLTVTLANASAVREPSFTVNLKRSAVLAVTCGAVKDAAAEFALINETDGP